MEHLQTRLVAEVFSHQTNQAAPKDEKEASTRKALARMFLVFVRNTERTAMRKPGDGTSSHHHHHQRESLLKAH